MTDNIKVKDAAGVDKILSSDDVGGGVQVQRFKAQFGDDGSAVDVSSSSPLPTADAIVKNAIDLLRSATTTVNVSGTVTVAVTGTTPVSGPLTDAQLRASKVPVDNGSTGSSSTGARVPLGTATAAAVTHTFDDSGSSPAASPVRSARMVADSESGANFFAIANMLWDSDASTWRRARAARAAAATLPPAASAATTPHSHDVSANVAVPVRTARSAADTDDGVGFAPSGVMRFNGSQWSRSRTSTNSAQALLASADRAASVNNGTFAFPSFGTFDCPSLLMMLHVTGIGTGSLALTVKALGSNATLAALTVAPANVTNAAAGNPVDVCLMLGASASYGGAITANTTTVAALRYGVSAVPIPTPGQITGYVLHTDTSTWTYSLDYHLIA